MSTLVREVKTSSKQRTHPTRIELARYYCEDAQDFLVRFRALFYARQKDFQAIKSRRAKAYLDLRLSIEALLKGMICLRASRRLCGRPLISTINRYRHNLSLLIRKALKGLRIDAKYRVALRKCGLAPVGLRHSFDAMSFRPPDGRHYAQTVGSTVWLQLLEEFAERGIVRLKRPSIAAQSGHAPLCPLFRRKSPSWSLAGAVCRSHHPEDRARSTPVRARLYKGSGPAARAADALLHHRAREDAALCSASGRHVRRPPCRARFP